MGFTRGDTRTCMRAADFNNSRNSNRDPCMDFLTTNNLIKATLTAISLTPTNTTLTSAGALEALTQAHPACMAVG